MKDLKQITIHNFDRSSNSLDNLDLSLSEKLISLDENPLNKEVLLVTNENLIIQRLKKNFVKALNIIIFLQKWYWLKTRQGDLE